MQMIVRNPTQGIYPATSDYVHAMEVREPKRLLYVAGTMGLDQNGVAGRP
jgi:2-iminobutanoate/2-iminopropanoate deaminase